MQTKKFNIILFLSIPAFLLFSCQRNIEDQWEITSNALITRWANDIQPASPLPEYPRPMLVREEWKSLNGVWDYSIIPVGQDVPEILDGKILVPYPAESALSGVKRRVGEDSLLWYSTRFTIPETWANMKILLHFEAVDWETKVWVNDQIVGTHKGGYDPFSFDITENINDSDEQIILISVYDPTDGGTQPRGKQVANPRGIWYTPVTGIWQTVWIEPVPEESISEIFTVTNIDSSTVAITVHSASDHTTSKVTIEVLKDSQEISSGEGVIGNPITLTIPDAQLWSPDSPTLYDLRIKLFDEGKTIDEVSSYFGMRKISLGKDESGITRMLFNNEFIFQNGPLDQGFWPDGIYTAPTDDALKYDIEVTKELGFNMLRKHVKIESRRFYYWCDQLGILVWQDMPSGDRYIGRNDPDLNRSSESAVQFEKELEKMIHTKFNHPSIIMWVPFNEGWGQYNTEGVVNLIKELDPTRLVNNTSGWSDRGVGDVFDIHNYPDPRMPEPEEDRAIVLGEFGGLGLPIEGHTWIAENWGYENMSDREDLINRYEQFYTQVYEFMENGLSASIYTQITDVETETNGLMTYDREIIKLDVQEAFNINTNNYISAPEIDPMGGWFNENDTVLLSQYNDQVIRFTTDGSDPDNTSQEYTQPISLTDNTLIKARAFLNNHSSRVAEATFTKTDIIRPVYSHKFADRYSAGGDFGLLDNERGSTNRRDGKWQGFEEQDIEITFDLGQSVNISEVTIGCLESTRQWIFFPEKLIIEVSDDGEKYRQVGELEQEIPSAYREASIQNFIVDFYATSARYIRLHVGSIKECPEWHDGAGRKAWVFMDEVIFN